MKNYIRIASWVAVAILFVYGFIGTQKEGRLHTGGLLQEKRIVLEEGAEVKELLTQIGSRMPTGWEPQAWESGSDMPAKYIYGVDWGNYLATENPAVLMENYITRYAGRHVPLFVGDWRVIGAYPIESPFVGVAVEIMPKGLFTGGNIRGVIFFRGEEQQISALRQQLFDGNLPEIVRRPLVVVSFAKTEATGTTLIAFSPQLSPNEVLSSELKSIRNVLYPTKTELRKFFEQRKQAAKTEAELDQLKKEYEKAKVLGVL